MEFHVEHSQLDPNAYAESSSLPALGACAFRYCVCGLRLFVLHADYQDRQLVAKNATDADARKTQALAAEVDMTNARIADLKGQLDVTSRSSASLKTSLPARAASRRPSRSSRKRATPQLRQQIAVQRRMRPPRSAPVSTRSSPAQKATSPPLSADLEATKSKSCRPPSATSAFQSGTISYES